MIVPPIILQDADGCLGIYESAGHAASSLDADDVAAGEYTGYDSEGRALAVEPVRRRDEGVARIVARERTPTQQQQLRAALITALAMRGSEPLPDSLSELLELALRRKRGVHLP
jgi:hypothetical protein